MGLTQTSIDMPLSTRRMTIGLEDTFSESPQKKFQNITGHVTPFTPDIQRRKNSQPMQIINRNILASRNQDKPFSSLSLVQPIKETDKVQERPQRVNQSQSHSILAKLAAKKNSSYAITTKQGLMNSQILQLTSQQNSINLGLKPSYNINTVSNLHYRGSRQPGLVAYAGGGGLSHVLPINQRKP